MKTQILFRADGTGKGDGIGGDIAGGAVIGSRTDEVSPSPQQVQQTQLAALGVLTAGIASPTAALERGAAASEVQSIQDTPLEVDPDAARMMNRALGTNGKIFDGAPGSGRRRYSPDNPPYIPGTGGSDQPDLQPTDPDTTTADTKSWTLFGLTLRKEWWIVMAASIALLLYVILRRDN